MSCRIVSLLWLSAALAVPQAYAGELPPPAGLGQLESLLDSCSKVNPQSAPDYQKLHAMLLRGASEKDLTAARAADGYKTAYKDTSDRLGQKSKDEAVKACQEFLGTTATPTKDAP